LRVDVPPEFSLRTRGPTGYMEAESERGEVEYAISGPVALAVDYRAKPSILNQRVAMMEVEVHSVSFLESHTLNRRACRVNLSQQVLGRRVMLGQ
jgi:hypothetical protein